MLSSAGRLLLSGLHRLPPETAHGLAIWALRRGWAGAPALSPSPRLRTRFGGLELAHPLGLAAGFDKSAEAVPGLFELGFGFVEVGTVTPRPQPGNPKPRLFRLAREQALINRMGFNNHGLNAVRTRLAKLGARPAPLGVNIGVNRGSAEPVEDYVVCLRELYPLVDYLTVNVSSPNTPGLRDLQRRAHLDELLSALRETRASLAGGGVIKPLLLKIGPDLSPGDEADLAEVALSRGIDGLVISNTTVDRTDLVGARYRNEAGGLSGPPLFARSTAQLGRFFRLVGGRLPLIGVGGIGSGADAYAKIRAGACALQLYTALVYQGPPVINRILAELDRRLAEDGYAQLTDAVGADRALS